MQSSFTRTAASTIALLAVSAPAAMADVTPQQVWDDLSAYMQNFGYSVTATQTETGDDLVVSDVTIAMDMPEEEGSFGIQMDEIVLTDRGDGSVDDRNNNGSDRGGSPRRGLAAAAGVATRSAFTAATVA